MLSHCRPRSPIVSKNEKGIGRVDTPKHDHEEHTNTTLPNIQSLNEHFSSSPLHAGLQHLRFPCAVAKISYSVWVCQVLWQLFLWHRSISLRASWLPPLPGEWGHPNILHISTLGRGRIACTSSGLYPRGGHTPRIGYMRFRLPWGEYTEAQYI